MGLDLAPIPGSYINLLFHQCEKRISMIYSWCQEGHPVDGNNKMSYNRRFDVVLTTRNCPTLPQCVKEGVVLYELRSRGVQR